MKIAILGVGTVGSGVIEFLIKNKNLIAARAGEEIIPVIGLARNLKKHKDSLIPLTSDIDTILRRDDIDVFVELMGGIETPYEIISAILKKKKPVVTANKALLAYHQKELLKIAGDTPFGYEASVAGGIPVIKALREGFSANNIEKIIGILNGTSNYILSDMMINKVKFEDSLARAQKLGYAEADPTLDIGGFDAAHKLLILANIAYNIQVKPEEILIEGIENISKEDIDFAKNFGYTIKPLAIAKKINENIELRVHPTLISADKMTAKVDGVMNAVGIKGDAVGETLLYGAGAGAGPTASAVISDLIDIARKIKSPMLVYKNPNEISKLNLIPKDQIESKFYLRLKAFDQAGVLARIAKVMSENGISIDSFLQNPCSENKIASIFFTTHTCKEFQMKKVLEELNKENFLRQKPVMIRMEK